METKKFSLKEFIISEKFYFWFIVTLMIAIPLGELIMELFKKPYISQPYILAVYGGVGFVSVILFFVKNAKSGKLDIYPSDIFFMLLVLFLILTFLFAKGSASLVGSPVLFEEWLLHSFAYFSLMFAGTMITDDRLRKGVLYAFAAVALFHCAVAFPQSFGKTISYCYGSIVYHLKTRAIYGFTTNCNFFAALCTMFTALSAGLFIFSGKGKKKWLFLALYVLCFYCLIATTARIAWLGAIGTHCLYMISFIVMKAKKYDSEKLKKHVLNWGIIIAAAVVLLIYFANFTSILSTGVEETVSDVSNSGSSGSGFDDFGSKRGYIWRFGFEAIPDNWLFGIGLNNYEECFHSNPRYTEGDYIAFLAHNEYLNVLVTQGVFAAINYMAFLVYSCVIGVKTVINTENDERRTAAWILLGMFAGYAAQALVNNSVINVAPYFWITVGMTMPKCEQKIFKPKLKRKA